jgi:hypothetical protein
VNTRFTICRQCPDQPLRSGTAGSEANRNVGAAGRRSANVTAGPCVSAPKIVKASGKDQVSGLLDGLRRSLARRLPGSSPSRCCCPRPAAPRGRQADRPAQDAAVRRALRYPLAQVPAHLGSRTRRRRRRRDRPVVASAGRGRGGRAGPAAPRRADHPPPGRRRRGRRSRRPCPASRSRSSSRQNWTGWVRWRSTAARGHSVSSWRRLVRVSSISSDPCPDRMVRVAYKVKPLIWP